MTPDELRPILAEYRKRVSAAWSKATAYAAFPSRPGTSDGQCGVTAAWLQERLAEDHGLEARFTEGTAYHRAADEELDHCWLEIGRGWQRVIIDITADQLDGLHDSPVICATFPELCSGHVSYIARRRLTAEEVRADVALRPRLALLEAALS